MASPSLQEQAWLEASGFAQANWGSSGPDYGSVSFSGPPPEKVIWDRHRAFDAGIVSTYRLLGYYPPTRETRDLSPYVQQVTYTEAEGQAGVTGSVDFLDLSKPGALSDWKARNSLRNFISRVGLILIWATAYEGRPLQERQRWINWEPDIGGDTTDTISFYDHLVYLANAEASFGYVADSKHPGGWDASQITVDICRRYGIPVKSIVRASYKIPYFLFTGTIYDAIATAYAFERHMTGKYFYITTDQGKLVVRRARSILHDPSLVFLLDPSWNVRQPLDFTRSLDQYAGGIIPTGVDSAGNPSYISSGNADANALITPQQGTADAALAGLTAAQAAAGSNVGRSLSATQKANQLAAAALFGGLVVNKKISQIRDPTYSKVAEQLLSNRLARAEKTLSALVDGNVLLRQGDRTHVLGYPLDLFVSSITQTLDRTDHQMQLQMAWREFEVSDMEDYHSVQQAGAQYASAQAALKSSPGGPSGQNASGSAKQLAAQAAKAFGLSSQTIWGVYGTESTFGADTSTSSAGAQGPMQFEPGTWAQYGDGVPGDIQKLGPSMFAAAKYLKALGADSNPRSRATYQALNNYNGNGGGTSVTGYVSSVLSKGASF